MKRTTEYIVVRNIATDELRICRIMIGYKPPNDNTYTYSGHFKSINAARAAIESGSEELRRELYQEDQE